MPGRWDTSQLQQWQAKFDPGVWQGLMAALTQLQPGVLVKDVPRLPFEVLPGDPGRALERPFESLCKLIAGADTVDDVVTRTAKRRRCAVAVPGPAITQYPGKPGQPLPPRQPGGVRQSAQRQAVLSAADTLTITESVALAQSQVHALSTRKTYASAVKVFVEWASVRGYPPFPLDERKVLDFVGAMCHARMTGKPYKSPGVILSAMWRDDKESGHQFAASAPRSFLKDCTTAAERGLPAHKQRLPISRDDIGRVFTLVANPQDYAAALCLAGAFFSLSRASTILELCRKDICVAEDASGVTVTFTSMKACKRVAAHTLDFECLADAPMVKPKWVPMLTDGSFALCPVEVFSRIRKMDAPKFLGREYTRFRTVLTRGDLASSLFQRAGLQDRDEEEEVPGSYGTHSARVGGACALLAAGLDSAVVKSLGNWASWTMVERYAARVNKCPRGIVPWAFFCPRAAAQRYNFCQTHQQGAPPTARQ